MKELQEPLLQYIGAALFLMGNTFVLSSMWALGVTGTYLGTSSLPSTPTICADYMISNVRGLLWNSNG